MALLPMTIAGANINTTKVLLPAGELTVGATFSIGFRAQASGTTIVKAGYIDRPGEWFVAVSLVQYESFISTQNAMGTEGITVTVSGSADIAVWGMGE